MLARWDRYRLNRALLGEVANFCLTVLQDRAGRVYLVAKGDPVQRKGKRPLPDFNACPRRVLGVSRLREGGDDARKGIGRNHPFTEEERSFLEAAVTTFIRRAAEKAADSQRLLMSYWEERPAQATQIGRACHQVTIRAKWWPMRAKPNNGLKDIRP